MLFRRLIFTLLFLFLCHSVSLSVNGQFRVAVKFSEISNLTYQLDCVSKVQIACSEANFSELWKREFLKTDEDRRLLEDWANLREFYAESIRLNDKSNEGRVLNISLFDKVRIAGFQAANLEDYVTRLDLLVAPSDRRAFERVIRHFYPAFDSWWQREAFKFGEDFRSQTDALLQSPKISGQLRQFYDFYAPDLPPNYEINFALFYRPDLVKETTNGEQLENYSVMEFLPNERPQNRIDVAIHELNHFFYESIKPEDEAKLRQRFFAEQRAGAIPAYNLLNEALATSFGNGMIARTVTPADKWNGYFNARLSFYNNEGIDRAAKGILPWLDKWQADKRTIHDVDFAREYISTLEKTFGEDLSTPKLYLSEMYLMVDEKYGVSMRREVRNKLQVASFYAAEGDWKEAENLLGDFKNNPRLNSLFIVHPDNIAELARHKIVSESDVKQIQQEYETRGSVLYAAERASFTFVYVIAAKNAEEAKGLIDKLAHAKQFRSVYAK